MSTVLPYANLVEELYVAYFGRPADYYGLQNFEAALIAANAPTDPTGLLAAYATNSAVKESVDAFGSSAESAALYGGTTTEAFVNAIYESLFNRPAAVAGLEFWAGAIDSGGVTRGQAALAIAAGAESNTTAQGAVDWQTVQNKAGAAAAFTADLLTSDDVTTYAGAAMAAEGRLFVAGITATKTPAQYEAEAQTTVNNLNQSYVGPDHVFTTGTDNFVGDQGINIYSATLDNVAGLAAGGQAQTLNPGDSILNGSSSTINTLNLTDFGLGGTLSLPVGVTLVDITQLNIASLEAVSGDFSGWNGLMGLRVSASIGDDNITVANNVTVVVNDSLGNVTVDGGDNVEVETDAQHAVSITSTAAHFQAMIGDNTTTIADPTAGASVAISVGAGADTITLGANATGTVSFAAHTAADAVVLGPSGASLTGIVTIAGMNNAGSDTIAFAGETGHTLAGFTQVTQADVAATGANPELLASWVAAADGAAGSGITGGAHTVTWFQFEGQTFLLESVAGQSADAGTMAPGNTLVELTGTGYTFAHATGAGGTVHLLG